MKQKQKVWWLVTSYIALGIVDSTQSDKGNNKFHVLEAPGC